MYLFYRTARLQPGSAHEEMAWSVSITEKVNQISEATFNLWTPFLSPGVNTLVWTTAVEDLSVLEATNDKLMADSGYMMLLEQSARYASGDAVNDGLTQLLVADMDAESTTPGYVYVVESRLAPGGYARGIEVGITIAEQAKKITGAPVSFGIDATGNYGGVTWTAGYETIHDLQRGGEALNSDPGFAAYLDENVPTCFQPDATHAIYRRIV